MSTINRRFLKILLTATAIFIAATVAFCFIGKSDEVYAYSGEKIFSAEQTSEITYCGADYLYDEKLKNKFLDAFSFKIDDAEITPDYSKITIEPKVDKAIAPEKGYKCVFTYNDGEDVLSTETVSFNIGKAKVTVTALLNGQTVLTVDESEAKDISVVYDYACDVTSDVKLVTVNGIQVRTLSDDVLRFPARIDSIPTDPVQNCKVVPGNAQSYYYDFVYATSILNIVRTVIPELKYESKTQSGEGETKSETLVSLIGSFSTAYDLSFVDVGTSKTSKDFTAINAEAEKKYKDSGNILRENDMLACYSINVNKNEKLVNDVNATVRIKFPEKLSDKNSYSVIALYNNGDTDVLYATVSDGYLTFNATDMGDFIVISPVEGISTTTYIIVIGAGVIAVLLIILLVAFFRKKY